MDQKQKESLLASASPEARAGYEKLDKAGLLTDAMLEALAALSQSLAPLEGSGPGGALTREDGIRIEARHHGMSLEETERQFDLYGI